MIEYIRGELTDLTPATTVLECSNGVGYLLNISLNTYSALSLGKEAKLYVYESVREDAWVLYGFASRSERDLFMQLISVSGIGGNTARMILSAFTVPELCDVISTGNDKMLKNVKGIGLKTAGRIIVDLKDKVAVTLASGNGMGQSLVADGQASGMRAVHDEAVSALTMLGFQGAASSKVVTAILKEEPTCTVEKVIKLALKRL